MGHALHAARRGRRHAVVEGIAYTALIVGAGIGGLAAGVALQRRGWRTRIFERADNPRELGFALNLASNAIAALRELGVADEILSRGYAVDRAVALRSVVHGALLPQGRGLACDAGIAHPAGAPADHSRDPHAPLR